MLVDLFAILLFPGVLNECGWLCLCDQCQVFLVHGACGLVYRARWLGCGGDFACQDWQERKTRAAGLGEHGRGKFSQSSWLLSLFDVTSVPGLTISENQILT